MNIKSFIYGDYQYEYTLITQERKTLSLTVQPDMSLIVKCPHKTSEDRIEMFLRKKWSWMNKQLRFFEKFERSLYKKEYISGESFIYLGRQYKLIVRRESEDRVSLTKGKLYVFTSQGVRNSDYNRNLIDQWYRQRTEKIFQERYSQMLNNFGHKDTPELVIKKMNKRWGSFTNSNRILLNTRLIHASKDCIDYVITHELCHLAHKNHNKDFWKLLDKKYPEWKKTKEKLEFRCG